ncbi:MAG TPA: hypothetical protein VMR74_13600 [Gammaproteobacteria bacterium]|nr:hypothetical protein [Gammaproteobacteria bacterium]
MLIPFPGAFAQDQLGETIHWAYSAYFGTGRYELDNGDSTYVLGGRPRKLIREPTIGEQGERSAGIELFFPIAVGVYDFDPTNIGGTARVDNVGTVSIVPGAAFEMRLDGRWSLKPFVHVGWGAEIDGDASAWLYWAGLKTQARFSAESFDWMLVNGLAYLGYSNDTGEDGNLLSVLTAFEFERPSRYEIAGHQVRLHWHVAYTDYLNELKIAPRLIGTDAVQIDDEWEIGAAFSTGEHRLGIKRLRWDRVGIAYRFSSNGDFEGIGLTFTSLFDR